MTIKLLGCHIDKGQLWLYGDELIDMSLKTASPISEIVDKGSAWTGTDFVLKPAYQHRKVIPEFGGNFYTASTGVIIKISHSPVHDSIEKIDIFLVHIFKKGFCIITKKAHHSVDLSRLLLVLVTVFFKTSDRLKRFPNYGEQTHRMRIVESNLVLDHALLLLVVHVPRDRYCDTDTDNRTDGLNPTARYIASPIDVCSTYKKTPQHHGQSRVKPPASGQLLDRCPATFNFLSSHHSLHAHQFEVRLPAPRHYVQRGAA